MGEQLETFDKMAAATTDGSDYKMEQKAAYQADREKAWLAQQKAQELAARYKAEEDEKKRQMAIAASLKGFHMEPEAMRPIDRQGVRAEDANMRALADQYVLMKHSEKLAAMAPKPGQRSDFPQKAQQVLTPEMVQSEKSEGEAEKAYNRQANMGAQIYPDAAAYQEYIRQQMLKQQLTKGN